MALDLDTGKYAVFVWGSYGATAVVIGTMILDSLTRSARWRRETERLQAGKDVTREKP